MPSTEVHLQTVGGAWSMSSAKQAGGSLINKSLQSEFFYAMQLWNIEVVLGQEGQRCGWWRGCISTFLSISTALHALLREQPSCLYLELLLDLIRNIFFGAKKKKKSNPVIGFKINSILLLLQPRTSHTHLKPHWITLGLILLVSYKNGIIDTWDNKNMCLKAVSECSFPQDKLLKWIDCFLHFK